MYASMYALLYIYDFTESNLTTRYYVFRKRYGNDVFFLVSLKSPIGLKRKIYLKADTHGVLVYYYTQKFYIWKWTLGLLVMERIERADDDKLVYVVNPLDYMRFCFIN